MKRLYLNSNMTRRIAPFCLEYQPFFENEQYLGWAGGTPKQQSSIVSARPFPNEHPPLWATWGEFFKAAEGKSKDHV
jgi:hypothetical protein